MCTDNQLNRWDAKRIGEYLWYQHIEGQTLVLSLIKMQAFISFHILLLKWKYWELTELVDTSQSTLKISDRTKNLLAEYLNLPIH